MKPEIRCVYKKAIAVAVISGIIDIILLALVITGQQLMNNVLHLL